MDQQTGVYTVGSSSAGVGQQLSPNAEERCYLYCPYIDHAGLASIEYKTFFHLCRVEGVSFDLEKRQGATFILSDTLQSGVISIIAIGNVSSGKARSWKARSDQNHARLPHVLAQAGRSICLRDMIDRECHRQTCPAQRQPS
jgi:hypothetical protein